MATTHKRATSRPKSGSTVAAGQTAGQPLEQPTLDEVRVRAYHRYLERGAGHGNDLEDWVEAEKELKVQRQS